MAEDITRTTKPNDEEEQGRMDLLHHIYSLILDGEIHTAPINNPRRVLDIGEGTGIWAVDFADQYPSAEVMILVLYSQSGELQIRLPRFSTIALFVFSPYPKGPPKLSIRSR
ncbi:hypothetical protein BBP40_010829 [Aspergillus hancockii]|nr:hypothetical protein BBP40_010829 [Aspergillus hancockii]